VDLEALDRSTNQFAHSEWGASVRAYVSCTIEGASGQTSFNLSRKISILSTGMTITGGPCLGLKQNPNATPKLSQSELIFLSLFLAYSDLALSKVVDETNS
jgi:hypothetical protein